MAGCLNISQSTYSRYESENIKLSIDKINRILEILNIDFLDLVVMNVDDLFKGREGIKKG